MRAERPRQSTDDLMSRYYGKAPRMRVQIENTDGTWTELPIDNGLSLEVNIEPSIGIDDTYHYSARFAVDISHRTWHDLLWDLSHREVRERDARTTRRRYL